MMKKQINIVKIINFIVLVIMILSTIMSTALATGILAPDDYNGDKSKVDVSGIVNVGNQVVSAIRVVGTILSVGVLVVLGIKFMMSSPEGKANYKGAMMPYVIGATLLFAATWIATAIYEAVMSTQPNTGGAANGGGFSQSSDVHLHN